jgi:hypothetical protein
MPHLIPDTQLLKKGRHWCFTIHGYTEDTEQHLADLAELESTEYLVYGREICPTTGNRHLQGFVSFVNRRIGRNVVTDLTNYEDAPHPHVERANGQPYAAALYCKKDGQFEEYGTPPDKSGKKGVAGQFALYRTWVEEFVKETGRGPYEGEIAREYPNLFCMYHRRLLELTKHLIPPVRIEMGELRDWQIELNNELSDEGTDRPVVFYVDPEGGNGKSYFQRWFLTNYPDRCQLLAPGKRDDLAHAIDVSKSVFLFNVPRGSMEFLQYGVLEQLKDRVIFSPKYESTTKVILQKTHVVVFCNEEPDLTKMSADRYVIRNLNN